jgi:O-antigen/teichoic acid export membrane protein
LAAGSSKVHSALRVTALSSGVNFGLALVAAVVIARLLSPREIGIHSVAVSLVAFTHILREFGVGQYFLQLPVLDRDHLRAGFTAMLIMSWGIAAVLLLTAGAVAGFYGEPGVGDVFRTLAASFMVLPFGSHILSQLKRELRFDLLAWVQMSTALVSTAASIYLAWQGHSYLSMAWGTVLGNIFTVLLLFTLRPMLALLTPTTHHLREIFRFGGLASSASLINQFGGSSPDIVLGKTQSMETVAHYSRAAGLLGMVAAKADEIVIQVFTPTFADRLRGGSSAPETLSMAITLHTGIIMPLLATLAVLGEPLTLLMFGAQWALAAQLAPWLLGYAVISAPVTLAQHALYAGGHAKTVLIGSVIFNTVLFAVFLSSIWLDLTEVVVLIGIVRIVMLVVWSRLLRKVYGFTSSHLASAVRPSLPLTLATGVAGIGASWAAGYFDPTQSHLIAVLAIGVIAISAYLSALRASRHPMRAALAEFAPPLRVVLRP